MSTLREYFLLSDATATAKRIPEGDRKQLERQLRAARQRAQAADALWSNGHTAEGLRLIAEAFQATLGAASRFADALGLEDAHAPVAPEAPASQATAPEAIAPETSAQASTDSADDSDDASSENPEPSSENPEPSSEAPEPSSEKLDAPAAPDATTPADEVTPQKAPAWRAALAARGMGGARLSDVVSAHGHVDGLTLPALDDDVTSEEGALFQKLVTSRNVVDHALTPATLTPGALLRTRLTRIGSAGGLVTAVVIGAAVLLWPTVEESARASSSYNAQFPPSNIIDDDPESEWLLPDDEAGWVEVRLTPPTRVNTVRLRNAHNRNHNDRATHAYTVEFYVDGAVAETVEAEWSRLQARPSWTEHAAGIDDVERIRVNVVSHHERGGGLAEVEWE